MVYCIIERDWCQMAKELPGEGGGGEPLPYEYFYDGAVRRKLHEFGASGVNFYDQVFRLMGYKRTDIALDVGAGMGHDGLYIASEYHPSLVLLLEPGSTDPNEDKYLPLRDEIAEKSLWGIELLLGVAEDIPLPDATVDKATLIHSAYEFDDLPRALGEVARVLKDDGLGSLVTNGPEDKLRFKEFIKTSGEKLGSKAPSTVSSRLDYNAAFKELSHYFPYLKLITYRDEMIITERDNRLDFYLYSYDSYRRFFEQQFISDGHWGEVRREVVEKAIRQEVEANNGVFRDTIDMGVIYFSKTQLPDLPDAIAA